MKLFNNFLTVIDINLNRIAEEIKKDREMREYDKLKGRMSDKDKLRLLKYELYSLTRARADSEYLFQLRSAVETFSKEVEKEHKQQITLTNQIGEISKLCVSLLALATVGSYTVQASGICQHNNSRFCNDARTIPNAMKRYFYNESVLNPETENNVIDHQSFTPREGNPRPKCKEHRSCPSGGTRFV